MGFNNLAVGQMPSTVATPVITPNGGTFIGSVEVKLSVATAGATIRYTTDGSEPTATSWIYQNPFFLSSSVTVKARAYKDGHVPSAVASAGFVINREPSTAVSVVGGDVCRRGDVNGDGKVTPGDALLVYQYTKAYVRFTDCQKISADATLNGTATVKDSLVIFDYSLGKIDRFVSFGDANLDGIVDSRDANLVFQFCLKSRIPTPTQAYVSDVNGDGKITPNDVRLIWIFAMKSIKEFPVDPLYGKGDVNQNETVTLGDALLVAQYISRAITLTKEQKWSAEVTGNNFISLVDVLVIFNYYLGKIDRLPIRFGDVTLDGALTKEDADLIAEFAVGNAVPTSTQRYVGDVNGDDQLTTYDAALVMQFILGKITEFPVDPLKLEPPVCGNGVCENGEAVDVCPQCLQEPCPPCYSCPKDCAQTGLR